MTEVTVVSLPQAFTCPKQYDGKPYSSNICSRHQRQLEELLLRFFGKCSDKSQEEISSLGRSKMTPTSL